jgi:hypothetical protein
MYVFGGYRRSSNISSKDKNDSCKFPQFVPTNEFFEYNLESGEYHLLNNDIVHDMQESVKLPLLAEHSMVLVGDRYLYIYGGRTEKGKASNQLYKFDILTDCWHLLEDDDSESHPCRYGHTATAIDNNIYFFGGTDGEQYYSDLYILNTENMKWSIATTQGTAPEPRAGHTCVLYSGEQLLVFGGGNNEKTFNDLYSLDLSTMTWRKEASNGKIEPSKRIYHTANIISSHMIIFGGDVGSNSKHSNNNNNLMLLDLDTKKWEYGAKNSDLKDSPPFLCGHTAIVSDSKLWIVGGKDISKQPEDTNCISQCVYVRDLGIQGIEPIEYGKNTISSDLYALVNAKDMMSDVILEFCGEFYYAHRSFLRVRCPVLHNQYYKQGLSNDANLNINRAIESLAKQRNFSKDYNNREIKSDFSKNISSIAFEALLEFIYTDQASLLEEAEDREAAIKDLAFLADIFKLDRLYALCVQHVASLDPKGSIRQLIPPPMLISDMKKMYELSQRFVPQLEEEYDRANLNESEEKSSSMKRHSLDSAVSNDVDHENDSNEPQTPTSAVSLNSQLSNNPNYTYCDVIFCVASTTDRYERIGAHKCVLIARSKFFNRMLSQQHCESNFEITGIRPQVFRMVIEYLYTGSIAINFDISVEMLIASEVYELEQLSLICQNIIERKIHVHNVCQIFVIADAYDIKHLRESCAHFIIHHLNQVKKTNSYKYHLEKELKKELREKKRLLKEQEDNDIGDHSDFAPNFFYSDKYSRSVHSDKVQKKKKQKVRAQAKHKDAEKRNNNKKRKATRLKKHQNTERENDIDNVMDHSPSPPILSNSPFTEEISECL